MNRGKIDRNYIIRYTVLFLVLCLLVYLPFILEKKSFIGEGDGMSQYILQLRYMGQWLRETLSNLLHGDFSMRTYDFTLGMGDDINAIVRFHPLDFLSVFVPAAYTEILYVFLIFLRLYIAGLAFAAYAFYWKKDAACVLAGSIVYLFCGYVFELGIVHPIYVAPMIVLPLLLLGAEYMMDRSGVKSFALLSIMVFLGFVSNYYFMYINSVALFIYALVRFFFLYETDRVRQFIRLFARMVLAYAIGLMMAAITLFPALSRYFNSYRSQALTETQNLLVYSDLRRYLAWFINLISPLEASGNGTHLNFAVIVLPCLVVLFAGMRKKAKSLKVFLILTLAFLLIPLGGYIMAVMHNENNRWVYIIGLVLSMTAVMTLDGFGALSEGTMAILWLTTAVFDAGVILYTFMAGASECHVLAAAELTLFMLILTVMEKKKLSARSILKRLLYPALLLSTALAGWFTFAPSHGNLVQYYEKAGTAEEYYADSVYASYTNVTGTGGEDACPGENVWADGFYRVDGQWKRSKEDNASIQLGYPGIQIYNSVLNASQIDYMLDTGNRGLTTMLHIRSLDARTGAEAVAGVKYFLTRLDMAAFLPYGYDPEPVWQTDTLAIYENQNPVSFGFTVDTVLSEADYESLTMAGRENIMLSAAVLEDDGADAAAQSGLDQIDSAAAAQLTGIEYEEAQLPETGTDVERTEDGYRAMKKNGYIEIPYETREGYDLLVELQGLVPDGFGTKVNVKTKDTVKSVTILSNKETYTLNRSDYLVELTNASCPDGGDTLLIRFTGRGSYALEGVRFVYVPRTEAAVPEGTRSFEETVAALNRNTLQDTVFSDDRVEGSISLEKASCMVFQIPYSRGWSAEVDGEKAELLKTDGCYMGLLLDAGEHEIVLKYTTPGLTLGRYLFFAGLLLLLTGVCFRRRQRTQAAAQ